LSAAKKANSAEPQDVPGLAVRLIAADIIDGVLRRNRALDELLDAGEDSAALMAMPDRDRALTRALIGIVLRHLGTLRHLLDTLLDRGLPAKAPRLETALLIGMAQILFLDVPDHAAVDLAVRLAREDRPASHFAGLVNAVLRRVTREGKERLAALDTAILDTPPWLMERWIAAYGADTAHAIAAANGREPALDLTIKDQAASSADHWAAQLGGRVLSTGSVRAVVHGPVPALPGFTDGAWWVQDAAAALPARLLGDVKGRRVADLCAAPGGKTAQLVAAGGKVTAVDRSAPRLKRMQENLTRLSLEAELICADASAATSTSTSTWDAAPFDAVLVDAPCSATGTIRRHPDVQWLKRPADIAKLSALQRRLLERAVALTRPGGTIVYCTCSLEPEEGREVVAELLAREPSVRRMPVSAAEVGGEAALIDAEGDLRTLPSHLPDSDSRFAGLDGFYAARLEKR
jgi:16S rRNA (cytosine967-C5)-methyltransferase